MNLTVSLNEQYERDGYVKLPKVLDDNLVKEAKEHLDWLMRKHPELRPEQLHTGLVKNDPFWLRLVSDDRLLDIAEQFIGPDIALFASHYICKPPFEGKPVLWHQDGAFWPLEPMKVVTLWLAVDDSTTENGCLRVIPGTHKMDLQGMNKRDDIANVLEYEVDPAYVDESKAVDVVLQAGGVSIHHPNIIHGSKANYSPNRRCGLTIRYIPTTTKIKSDEAWDSTFLLRGKEVPGINEYMLRPQYSAREHMYFQGCENWR
ncbi:phytanoyl-CoA dioxygenase family protein [Paenibacillus sp. GCM10027626]|uniref:phytanoyl-CoA dioxygenase family protein n=1 Tax=Paenibacillus sp. GCM10027626 TaxID=3273411 RepID=UPI003637C585